MTFNEWLRARLTTARTLAWMAKEFAVENKLGCGIVAVIALGVVAVVAYEFLHSVLRFGS